MPTLPKVHHQKFSFGQAEDLPSRHKTESWYMCWVKHNHEQAVIEEFGAIGVDVVIPLINKKPIFPGYAFTLADRDNWYRAHDLRRLNHWTIVQDPRGLEEDLLKIKRVATHIPIIKKPVFVIGAYVRIKPPHSLAGICGTVERITDNHISVNIQCLCAVSFAIDSSCLEVVKLV